MEHNKYLEQRRNRLRQYYRVRLGVEQMINKPLLNILLIPVIVLFIFLWKERETVILLFNMSKILYSAICIFVSFMAIMIPVLLFWAMWEFIGKLTARKDEAALLIAFEPKELRNGCPILISKKKLKGTYVTRREYYSDIPLYVWEEKKIAIADAMNIHFIEEIQYGGRANGKRIVIYTSSGRRAERREKLYDEEF